VAAMSLGSDSSCALLKSKVVLCWGFNGYGQLGIGSTTSVGTLPSQMGLALQPVSLDPGAHRLCRRIS
jgi:alpha-tubulin suppressor-like RCC1 family protein